ncbi:cobyric acid synthase [Acetobacter orleanensis]|nr:cobyric acid synthase [Acetobacter orleanensis]KXV62470.1 cobalamin biosynthesis protein CobQ [Acetobacter orleanensis]PCD80103.1 cobyric acid synthase [Acetobacter orleanensis]GBR22766.1 cobyric acid synthase [Acetobacter orleanensis NRIC 0473]
MVQGTGSSVGKSTLVAGLARAFTRRGLRVRPFKPQNMSNNAAVTADGGEIGRAQALQARACGVRPTVDMNPVLLKPQGETGAQLVVRGQVRSSLGARDYQNRKDTLLPVVVESFQNLAAQADIVLVEGAGSASEVNLRARDIANMGFAEAVNAPVVLVGDIDRGGVIASLVGTQVVLPPEDSARIKGFIVNKMRGDLSLFHDGMDFIAQRTGWAALGLVPDLPSVRTLPAEDAADLLTNLKAASAARPVARSAPSPAAARCVVSSVGNAEEPYTASSNATPVYSPVHNGGKRPESPLRIAVPLLPMIANFDDLDPLCSEPGVLILPVPCGERLPECDLVLLPGSKATLTDLATLRAEGWADAIRVHVAHGGHVMGICGGYQMLGQSVADPHGTEGPSGTAPGLGLLAVETVLSATKHLQDISGTLAGTDLPVSGYEIHTGHTTGHDRSRPLLVLNGVGEGAGSTSGQVYGTYLHGIFGHRAARMALLARAGGAAFRPGGVWYQASLPEHHDTHVEQALDRLADHLEAHINLDVLLSLATVPDYKRLFQKSPRSV